MATRRSFKSDASFLEKISMGATGTLAVFCNLGKQGHSPIVLERGSTSFKIWKNIKIKRIRVPDLLCINCAKCIECRAKTSMGISMSHSQADPERGWDRGLDDGDRIAFVVCDRAGDDPTAWEPREPVQYVSVEHLREAEEAGQAIITEPKGAGEGFEMRILWPISVAKAPGTIRSVQEHRIQYNRERDDRVITLKMLKNGKELSPLVVAGDSIRQNQVIASVVSVSSCFPCKSIDSEGHYLELLRSASLVKKYAAVKALGTFSSPEVREELLCRMGDPDEHVYVRLEAAAGLARQGQEQGFELFKEYLTHRYLEQRLEAVIVLGEIANDRSCTLLVEALLDRSQDPEIRAGAAWSLGELRNRLGLDALVESFEAVENNIRVEAVRALGKLAERFTPDIINKFTASSASALPGISWALSKAGAFHVHDLTELLINEDARRWVAYVIGSQEPNKYICEIEDLKQQDPEVYFAVTVLWTIMSSWVWGLEEY